MLRPDMREKIFYLNSKDELGTRSIAPVGNAPEPTNPPVMIPCIDADGSLFPVEKIRAHVEGIHHLALSVFVFAGSELLIQKRADTKYHCANMWANTCCTHPHMGETLRSAALRRLQEELGFSVPVSEKRIVEYSADVGGGLWERERVHMFRADTDKNSVKPLLNPNEVSEIRWISADQLREEMRISPERFTPWFRIYVRQFPDLEF